LLQRRPRGRATYLPWPKAFFTSILACSKVEKEDTHSCIGQLLLQLATMDVVVNATRQQSDDHAAVDDAIQHKCASWHVAMLSTPVLDTIAELLLIRSPLFYESQSHALDLIYHFLRRPQNRSVLAQNAELLSAMVEFLLVSDNEEKKKLAKAMVLEIVPEI
jgi:hypothetical protein